MEEGESQDFRGRKPLIMLSDYLTVYMAISLVYIFSFLQRNV